jgi:hypothetical protein
MKQAPIPKLTKAKRAGSMAQVVEHLHSKHKSASPKFKPHVLSKKERNKGEVRAKKL